jgi:hypothetical protein
VTTSGEIKGMRERTLRVLDEWRAQIDCIWKTIGGAGRLVALSILRELKVQSDADDEDNKGAVCGVAARVAGGSALSRAMARLRGRRRFPKEETRDGN